VHQNPYSGGEVLSAHAMMAYGGVEVQTNSLLTLIVNAGEWLTSCPGHFTPLKRVLSTCQIGGWVSPRVGVVILEKKKDF
jgi:hypothetical protein